MVDMPLIKKVNNLLQLFLSFARGLLWLLQGEEILSEADKDLKDLKESLRDTQPAGQLVQKCRTLDQVILLSTWFIAMKPFIVYNSELSF